MSEAFEIDLIARDQDTFRLKPHSLFEPVLARQPDFSTRANHAMPWNIDAGS
jgi:hypothetical protein